MIAGLVQRFLVQRRGDDAADASRQRKPHALLDRLVGEAAAIGGEHAGRDRGALLVRLQEGEIRPVIVVGPDLRDIEVGCDLAVGLIAARDDCR